LTFAVEVFPERSYAVAAAVRIAGLLPKSGNVVITGGTTAGAVYRALASMRLDWSGIDILFSDERCVPPDDDHSNYKMAKETLLDHIAPRAVHRIRGEDDPDKAAAAYAREIAPLVERGLDLTILGMGADCHIAALFPGSPALSETERLAVAVERPDGMKGITLTFPALLSSRRIALIVTGESKANAVQKALSGHEPKTDRPVSLLETLDATFFLDGESGVGYQLA
jgi:6-phosphogluconolactonase